MCLLFYNSPSLKRYQEMPWSHFLNNEADELKDSIDILLRNNDAPTNIDYQFNVYNNGNQVYHYPLIGISRNVTVLDYNQVGNFSLIVLLFFFKVIFLIHFNQIV